MIPLYIMPLQTAPEVIDRIPSGYSNFVIPFVVGISFMLIWLTAWSHQAAGQDSCQGQTLSLEVAVHPEDCSEEYQGPVLRLPFPYENLETQAASGLHALGDCLRMVHAHCTGTSRSGIVRSEASGVDGGRPVLSDFLPGSSSGSIPVMSR